MSKTILDEPVELHPLLSERWSPRSFHQQHEISDQAVRSLLEAARWAPSANNSQPWRYIVAKRDSEDFERIAAALAPANRVWARHASLLIVALGVNVAASPYAAYDLGQSVAHLSVQAHAIGYHTHQMGGFDTAVLSTDLELPTDLTPLTVIAIGEVALAEQLPERLRERELAQRTRQPLSEITLRGLSAN